MSDSDNAQQEPTMEEILASIRRIISEDGEDEAAPEVVEEDPVEEEVFELTDIAEEEDDYEDDFVLVDNDPEPEPEPVYEPEPEPEPVYEPEPEPVMRAARPAPTPQPAALDAESLLGEEAAGMAMAAFGSLAKNASLGTATTIEDVVMAALRPLLKDWLDQNLPGIVEELVQREIDRVSGRGGS